MNFFFPRSLSALLVLPLVAAQCFPANSLTFRSPIVTAPGLHAVPIARNLTTPRGIAIDRRGTLLVIERGLGVTAFVENASTCVGGWLRSNVLNRTDLTQGIAVRGVELYVSTAGQVLKYAYNPATRTVSSTTPVVIVSGIPSDGELTTRPILLHGSELLVGSSQAANIDETARDSASGRSQVRSFTLPSSPTAPPLDFFAKGTLLAYGIRNPAAVAFASPSQLYVLDNGASVDTIAGLTTAFVNDNPADELNLIRLAVPKSNKGVFYGFPDCTTIWNSSADPVGVPQYSTLQTGDQFSLHLQAARDDTWCRNPANNVPPRLSFQSHSVPLDLKFFKTPKQASTASLPSSWVNDAFVTFRGSFNRSPPTGYGVVRVPFTKNAPTALASSNVGYEFIVQAANLTTCPGTCIRPVGLVFGKDGRLFVTSDSSGELFVVSSGN